MGSMRSIHSKLLPVVLLAAAATALAAVPASAAVDDSFVASTTDTCGTVNFIDYGPGAAGGGNNDDYLVIHDNCPDGHGVRAWAYLNGVGIGTQYNGNGNGSAVVWDPFQAHGNVDAGDWVSVLVCLVDGAGDTGGSHCLLKQQESVDG